MKQEKNKKKEEETQHTNAIEVIELRHKYKMEELEYARTTEKIKHQWELERMRIKTAEIRRNFERKALDQQNYNGGNKKW